MQVNSATQTQYTRSNATVNSQSEQSKTQAPQDSFERSELSDLAGAELALGLMTAALATPVAIGAAAGAAGVGAVALGSAALTYFVPDDSEYGTDYNSEAIKSAVWGASLAAVGAIGGTAAVATVGALGLAAGVAMWATSNS